MFEDNFASKHKFTEYFMESCMLHLLPKTFVDLDFDRRVALFWTALQLNSYQQEEILVKNIELN